MPWLCFAVDYFALSRLYYSADATGLSLSDHRTLPKMADFFKYVRIQFYLESSSGVS